MNRFTNDSGSDKKELLLVAAYYLVLLLIAMSWTEKALVQPKFEFRILFTVFLALPLFKYRYWTPAVLTTFVTIRYFSVSPYGYLPSDQWFTFYLTLLLFFFEIIHKNYTGRGTFSFGRSSKGTIALVIIVCLSNILNLNTEYTFLFLLATTIMLNRFVRSSDELQMIEIAFIVTTFCLSVYVFIFSDDFVVKEYVSRDLIQRSYWTDPNYFGCVIAIGIVISFYYFMNKVKDKVVYRALYLTVFIAGFITLGILASRGAFLAAIVPALYILYKKTNSIKNLVFVVLFIGVTITALSSTNYFAGLFSRINSGDTTGSDRTVIWESSLNTFLRSDMPMLLIGGGTNYCNALCGRSLGLASISPHNNFLAILYDYGILGLIAFLSMFYSWFSKNSHNVLAVSLVMYFGLVCFTLVPLMFYPFGFLLVLFECYGSSSESRMVQWGRSKYPKLNQWRMRRLSSLTSPRSMKAQ